VFCVSPLKQGSSLVGADFFQVTQRGEDVGEGSWTWPISINEKKGTVRAHKRLVDTKNEVW